MQNEHLHGEAAGSFSAFTLVKPLVSYRLVSTWVSSNLAVDLSVDKAAVQCYQKPNYKGYVIPYMILYLYEFTYEIWIFPLMILFRENSAYMSCFSRPCAQIEHQHLEPIILTKYI